MLITEAAAFLRLQHNPPVSAYNFVTMTLSCFEDCKMLQSYRNITMVSVLLVGWVLLLDASKVRFEITQYQVSNFLQSNDICIWSFLYPHCEWFCCSQSQQASFNLMWCVIGSPLQQIDGVAKSSAKWSNLMLSVSLQGYQYLSRIIKSLCFHIPNRRTLLLSFDFDGYHAQFMLNSLLYLYLWGWG